MSEPNQPLILTGSIAGKLQETFVSPFGIAVSVNIRHEPDHQEPIHLRLRGAMGRKRGLLDRLGLKLHEYTCGCIPKGRIDGDSSCLFVDFYMYWRRRTWAHILSYTCMLMHFLYMPSCLYLGIDIFTEMYIHNIHTFTPCVSCRTAEAQLAWPRFGGCREPKDLVRSCCKKVGSPLDNGPWPGVDQLLLILKGNWFWK